MFGRSTPTAFDLREDAPPMPGPVSTTDPLHNLREYRHLAPWNLRDLAKIAAAILDVVAVRPVNAAAASLPSVRTIRYYVAQQLVSPPEGRGTAAIYSYRHLLQVLAIKLRQMEGANLTSLAEEIATTSGDVLERRVAHVLGPSLPAPTALPLFSKASSPRGRTRRTVGRQSEPPPAVPAQAYVWHRLLVGEGVELHLRHDHPITTDSVLQRQFAEAVRTLLRRFSSRPTDTTATTEGSGAPSGSPSE